MAYNHMNKLVYYGASGLGGLVCGAILGWGLSLLSLLLRQPKYHAYRASWVAQQTFIFNQSPRCWRFQPVPVICPI